jgi:hypothetical protein
MYNQHMQIKAKSSHFPGPTLVAPALLLLAALSGCPAGGGKEAAREKRVAAPSAVEESPGLSEPDGEYSAGLALSLFKGTPLERYNPDAMAYSRDGSRIFTHGLNPDSGQYFAVAYSIGADKLAEGMISYPDKDFFVPFIAANPLGSEVLVASQWQPEPSHVRDVFWRIGPDIAGTRSGLPYDRAEGMPKDGPHDTWMGVSPFYSWDGQQIIVPLNQLGICVSDVRNGLGRYTEYPQLSFQRSGMAFGPLPDEGSARRIWASFWQMGNFSDHCEVWVLDLDALKWEKVFTLAWIAYEVGVSKVFDEPWLVAGSRSPKEGEDGKPLPSDVASSKRIPRLALVVPRAQTEDVLELRGDPVWDVALEARGRFACYMDRQRRGLVRLEPATGRLDLDSRFYCGDDRAAMYCAEDGAHVFYWLRGIFVEAKWDKHEDFEGYDEK